MFLDLGAKCSDESVDALRRCILTEAERLPQVASALFEASAEVILLHFALAGSGPLDWRRIARAMPAPVRVRPFSVAGSDYATQRRAARCALRALVVELAGHFKRSVPN